jgi:hypothetical protein
MVTQQERQKLVEDFQREPIHVAAVTVKCAVCLMIVGGLALIGVNTESAGEGAGGGLQAQRHESPSVAQSRALYEERQARLEAAEARARAASRSEHAADANDSKMLQ